MSQRTKFIHDYVGHEFFSKWLSATCMGRLDLQDSTTWTMPDGNKIETVINENGLLYFVIFLLLARMAGADKDYGRKEFYYALQLLEDSDYPGLLNRQPGHKIRHDAQDNMAAAMLGCVMFGELGFCVRAHSHASKHGGNMNNVDPKKWELKQQRQGGEIAFYATCASYTPFLTDWIWMLLGVMFNAFDEHIAKLIGFLGFKEEATRMRHRNIVSDAQLTFIRLEALRMAGFKQTWQTITFWPVYWIWKAMRRHKFGPLNTMLSPFYFRENGPTHPIVRIASLIQY